VLELTSQLARLFWEMLDPVDYAVTLVRCWAVDRIYGPEPSTSADKQREAEHKRLSEAFPIIDLAGTIEVDGKPRTHREPGAVGRAQVSDRALPRSEVPADRPID
jgi:hypothetical protein